MDLTVNGHHEKANFIFSIADLLRGAYRPHEYGQVILPLIVLRRLDCVLEETKDAVIRGAKTLDVENKDPILRRYAKQTFYNTSPLDFRRLLDDPAHIAGNLREYIAGFSPMAFDTFQAFGFERHIERLEADDLLFLVLRGFAGIDLHPDKVSNTEMGYIFEELIRRFSEQSNETAGEHFTPREVVKLMVDLLFIEDDELLREKGIIRTLYDPACGTGGMLSLAEEYLRELNPTARLEAFGQELNSESWAICRSDMMIKGQNPENIVAGNSFTKDGHTSRQFDYLLSNPPYGVDWKKDQTYIVAEAAKGDQGRFGVGLPRITDGSFLFLQHMVSKWRPPEVGGSRLAVVFNGSPLFAGDAGSGESEIRRWVIENDWLEAVIALPDNLFYNTSISTYIWVLTNRKRSERRGRVQLIDGSLLFQKMRKPLGEKRKAITEPQIAELVRTYADFAEGPGSLVFDNQDFGYRTITIERPLRIRYEATEAGLLAALSNSAVEEEAALGNVALLDRLQSTWSELEAHGAFSDVEQAAAVVDVALSDQSKPIRKAMTSALIVRDELAPVVLKKGKPVGDPYLRETALVPLKEDPVAFFAREIQPHLPDAWVEAGKSRIGYEIPFTRHFYRYTAPGAFDELGEEIRVIESEISRLLRRVVDMGDE